MLPKKQEESQFRQTLISDRNLALFLREIISEETRLGRSVPGPDCRDMLKMHHSRAISTDADLRRLVKRLVLEGLLAEDRKEKKVNLVGYVSTSATHDFIANQDIAFKSKVLADMQISDIRKLAKKTTQNVFLGMPKNYKQPVILSPPTEVELRQAAIQEAESYLANVEKELREMCNLIYERNKNLESRSKSSKSSPEILTRIRDQITILTKRKSEEEMRLEAAKDSLEKLVTE